MDDQPSIEKQLDDLARRLLAAKKLEPEAIREKAVRAIEAEIRAVHHLIDEMDADQSAGSADDDGFRMQSPDAPLD